MNSTFHPVSSISSSKDSWNLNVRVFRLWVSLDQYSEARIPFSMEMILIDEEGSKIHASVRKALIYKFQKLLVEGEAYHMYYFGVTENGGDHRTTNHPLKLNFQYETQVKHVKKSSIPPVVYSFEPITALLDPELKTDYLVDVMGILTGVGTEKEVKSKSLNRNQKPRNTRFIVIQLSVKGLKVQCTLFGPYVDEVNSYVSSGEVCNTVFGIQLAKAKPYQGKIGLQNTFHATKLFFDLKSPDALKLRKSYFENSDCVSQSLTQIPEISYSSVDEDDMINIQRKNIGEVKDCAEDCICLVLATIKHVSEGTPWWYLACNKCNYKVESDSGMYYCEHCVKHVITVTPRFRLAVRAMDDTDCATFVLFDREASDVLGKSCIQMVQEVEKISDFSELPSDIKKLVGKVCLFMVELKSKRNSNYEPSYRVKKMSYDNLLIKKFNDSVATQSSGHHIGSTSQTKTSSFQSDEQAVKPRKLMDGFQNDDGMNNSNVDVNGAVQQAESGLENFDSEKVVHTAVDLSVDDVVIATTNPAVGGIDNSSETHSPKIRPIQSIADCSSNNLKKKIKVEKE